MKYYATILNLEAAKDFSLEETDLFNPHVQGNLLQRILCGDGETEEEALQNAIENLEFEGVIELCKCGSGVQDIVTKLPWNHALRHLWLERDEYHGDVRLHTIPCHDALVTFCNRYNITEEAQQDLEMIFKTLIHKA